MIHLTKEIEAEISNISTDIVQQKNFFRSTLTYNFKLKTTNY